MEGKWSKEATSKLILLWQQHKNLFAIKINRAKTAKSLEEISADLSKDYPGITVDHVREKIRGLRSQYARELSKEESSIRNGYCDEDAYTPTLWCFDQLEFLQRQLKQRTSRRSHNNLRAHSPERFEMHEEEDVTPIYIKRPKPVEFEEDHIERSPSLCFRSYKTKYDWLGKAVTFAFAEMKDDEIEKDISWRIQCLLQSGMRKAEARRAEAMKPYQPQAKKRRKMS